MKGRIIPLLLALCLLLSGCGWLNGSYVSVKPHQEQRQTPQSSVVHARNYLDLIEALSNMVASGTETAAIIVADYPPNAVESGMAVAIRYVTENDPVGAYAVEQIRYELGSSAGQSAVALEITYRHSRSEIRQIHQLRTMEDAEAVVLKALQDYATGVVMLVEDYHARDFSLLVELFAEKNPQAVMEVPQVGMGVYGTGQTRVVEVTFTYQTGRDSLRQMQGQVKPVFDSAVLYVSGDGSDWQKYSHLYAFLMERFDYTLETSITPAYSLLRHGVGDSRAFAVVYSAMCRAAGLECSIVTGTKSGEPWSWNMVQENGCWYHVDLLRCSETGSYAQLTDSQMQGYVWDYSAYPQCLGPAEREEEDEVHMTTEDVTGPTETAGMAEETETENIF